MSYPSGPSPAFPGASPSPGNMFPNGPSPSGSGTGSYQPGASPGFPSQRPRPQQPEGQQPPAEDPAVKRKIEEMQIYVGPLKNTIERQKREGIETGRMINLLQILEGTSKTAPTLEILESCKGFLQHLMHRDALMIPPFLDSIESLMQHPSGGELFKHTVHDPWASLAHRKIKVPKLDSDDESEGSAAPGEHNKVPSTLSMHPSCGDSMCGPKDPKSYVPLIGDGDLECGEQLYIPMCIQREVASLDRRFGITMNKNYPVLSAKVKHLYLECTIHDLDLPLVPSLELEVPADYPSSSPRCIGYREAYDGTPFLEKVRDAMADRISKMGKWTSIGALLDVWETSVRQTTLMM